MQTRAGVRTMADKVGRSIRQEMPPIAQEFLQQQSLIIVGTMGTNRKMWVSAFAGASGFAKALDPHTIQVNVPQPQADPVYKNLEKDGPIGMIATDFVAHRRMRVNGIGHLTPGGLQIFCAEVYSNCGRYIQTRKPNVIGRQLGETRHRATNKSLTGAQQIWIKAADTFFIATSHPETGADVSHKGGCPGFVQVINSTELIFTDYAGNSLFNTLGNISENPFVGLLFLDFSHGHTLQISGQAEVLFAGASERRVHVVVDDVIEVIHAVSLAYEFIEYAPTNPK